ncbi:MAG: transposase family protein, partial [Planctomycetaceae bacterium]|nr:transposase family protein [Planctomycetaceae bacterium]
MERVKKALKMMDEQFKRIIGTTKPVFREMQHILQAAYIQLHKAGGKPPKLSADDKLLITLQYYREYR